MAAASLAWMMNPLNLDIIIVRMVMMMIIKRARSSNHDQGQPDCRHDEETLLSDSLIIVIITITIITGIIITIIITPFSLS